MKTWLYQTTVHHPKFLEHKHLDFDLPGALLPMFYTSPLLPVVINFCDNDHEVLGLYNIATQLNVSCGVSVESTS